MRKRIGLFVILAGFASSAQAIGLSMRFVDVTLENMNPGASINLRTDRNLPLVVINQDDSEPTDIVLEPVTPDPKELKEGYEAIPDPSWVHAIPNRFHLGPKASASADIIITVPNNPKLIGHHYEVILWVHSDPKSKVLPEGGVLFQVALRSRFRISVGTKGPLALQREKALKKLATIDANFSVNPDNLYVQDIPLGSSVDLKTEHKASIKIINQSDNSIELKVHPVATDPNVSPQVGYEYAPDFHWLDIQPEKIKVAGNSIKDLKLHLKIPDQPAYHNKKYMFLIQTTLADDSLPLMYYNMLYVTTAP